MNVVYARATGHVVGVRTGTGIGAAAPTVAGLVGPALPLQQRLSDNTVAELTLRAALLEATTADDNPDALLNPLMFEVQRDPSGAPKPALRLLAGWGSSDPVRLTPTSVTVDVGTPVNASTPVIVVLSGASGLPPTGEVSTGHRTVTLGARLDRGTYDVLLLVAGQQGWLTSGQVP